MKRFRVIKAAHIAFAAALLLLTGVIIVLAVRYVQAADAVQPAGNFAMEAAEAAFVASDMVIELLPDEQAITLSENEHADPTVEAPSPRLQPSVLIYHTHTQEAYQQTEADRYEESYDKWRTADKEYNVVRVGEELARQLKERGIHVVHDVTDHEQDDFDTAYVRSLETLQQYGSTQFDLYIDLHRDAYGTDPEDAVTVSVGQQSMAKLMMLVGTGENFSVKPDSTENYRFALELTNRINDIAPGLCRDVLVKNKRYNQHVGRCILLEVGHNLNTLDEALTSIPYFADALVGMLKDDVETVIALSGG